MEVLVVSVIGALDLIHKFEVMVPCPLTRNLRRAINAYPRAPWDDALSWGQINSKIWLIEQLHRVDRDLGTVWILGGWLGVLAALVFQDGRLQTTAIRSFDIDPSCSEIAETLNRDPFVTQGWQFKATTADMFAIDYTSWTYDTLRRDGSAVSLTEIPDTIINTSCDHIAPFDRWWSKIPEGKLVVLQNNDFEDADEDHVNTVASLDEMKAQAPMSKILFEGVLPLQKYNRFMLIGEK